jgi:hypothetical protein
MVVVDTRVEVGRCLRESLRGWRLSLGCGGLGTGRRVMRFRMMERGVDEELLERGAPESTTAGQGLSEPDLLASEF